MKTTFLQTPLEIQLVCNRLEIGFWRLTIDLMSDSKLLQKLVTGICELTWQVSQSVRTLERNRAVRWATAGLCIGFFTAIVSIIFNH